MTPPSPTHAKHNSLAGMLLAATAFALLTCVDTIFKLLATGHPAYQILLVNACFALVPIVAWSFLTGGLKRLQTLRPGQHLLRGSASVLAAFAAIFAYSRLPLTDYYAVVFAGPLLVTALSSFWLGEKAGPYRWGAIITGFCGIAVVINPFSPAADHDPGMHYIYAWGRFAACISVFCYALSTIMVRRMRISETNMTFSFYGYIASLLISGGLLLVFGAPELHAKDILHLALSGTLAGLSSICLMTAYHRTPVALVAPFQYTQIIWGALAGYIFWQHLPDMRLAVGAAIVAASGLFVIYRELRVKDPKRAF